MKKYKIFLKFFISFFYSSSLLISNSLQISPLAGPLIGTESIDTLSLLPAQTAFPQTNKNHSGRSSSSSSQQTDEESKNNSRSLYPATHGEQRKEPKRSHTMPPANKVSPILSSRTSPSHSGEVTPAIQMTKQTLAELFPDESRELTYIAAAYCAYPDDGKTPQGIIKPAEYLKVNHFIKNEDLSTIDISVFKNTQTQEVIIGFRGTNCTKTIAASIGSCAEWERKDYDAAGKSIFPFSFLPKPYTFLMMGWFFISVLSGIDGFTNYQFIDSYKHFAQSLCILSLTVAAIMYFNIIPKMFYGYFDTHLSTLMPTVENALKPHTLSKITFVGHSLGGILAQIFSGIYNNPATVFSTPGGAYELLLAFASKHKADLPNGIPSWDKFKNKISPFGIEGDPIPTLQRNQDIQNYVMFPSTDGHPHKILTLYTARYRDLAERAIRHLQ